MFVEFWKWRKDAYPQVVSLDAALHKEDGAPHVHERHVWVAHDKEGREIVSQTKALEEMGVPRPDEAKYRADMAAARKIKDKAEREKAVKKAGLHNNAKMTYTATCRAKLIEIAKAHGFEIIETPKEPGESGLSQARYKARDEERKAEAAKRDAAKAVQVNKKAEAELVNLTGAIITAERELGDLTEFRAWKRDKAAQEAQEGAGGTGGQEAAGSRQSGPGGPGEGAPGAGGQSGPPGRPGGRQAKNAGGAIPGSTGGHLGRDAGPDGHAGAACDAA